MKKITESFHNYKGYIIRLRAITFGGFGYSIIKQIPNETSPNEIRNIYLRKVAFNFISSQDLLSKAINYIDNYEDRLIIKFETILKLNK